MNRKEESMIDEHRGPSTAGVGSAALCAVHPGSEQRGPSDAVQPYVLLLMPSGRVSFLRLPRLVPPITGRVGYGSRSIYYFIK